MLRLTAFALEPIPSRKLHCYGKDRHPMAVAHRRHSLNLYFVLQSRNQSENSELVSYLAESNGGSHTLPSSLAMANMFRWLLQLANLAAKIGGSGLKSAWKCDGAMPRQQS